MSVLGRVAGYASPHRAAILVALLLVLLHAALEVAKPWPIKVVADYVLGDGTLAPLAELSRPTLLLVACAGLLVLSLTLAGVNVLLSRATVLIGQKMVSELRADLVNGTFSLGCLDSHSFRK